MDDLLRHNIKSIENSDGDPCTADNWKLAQKAFVITNFKCNSPASRPDRQTRLKGRGILSLCINMNGSYVREEGESAWKRMGFKEDGLFYLCRYKQEDFHYVHVHLNV